MPVKSNIAVVVMPASFPGFVVTPEQLSGLPYDFSHVATNTATRETCYVIQADTPAGVAQFLAAYPQAEVQPSGKYKGNKANWVQNAFPAFRQPDDDSPLTVYSRGIMHLDQINESRKDKDKK